MNDMKTSRAKVMVSLVLNAALAVMVACAVAYMAVNGGETFSQKGIHALRFFTVDSNVLAGVAALVCAVCQVRVVCGRAQRVPRWVQVLKLAGTTAVTLTFLVVIVFLIPVSGLPAERMYTGSNFILHLVAPLLALADYLLLAAPEKLGAKHLAWCCVPTLAYEVFYGTNALTHIQDGVVPAAYDWYHFLSAGPASVAVAAPLFLAVTLLLALALNRLAARRSA